MKRLERLRSGVVSLLKQGMSPKRIAVCIVAGVALSIFPIIGVPTLACGVVALVFRLNLPLIQAVNYAFAPLQWLCIVPFLRLGEWVTGAEPLPLRPAEITAALREDAPAFLAEFSGAIVHATVGWLLVVPPLFVILYRVALKRVGAVSRDRVPSTVM